MTTTFAALAARATAITATAATTAIAVMSLYPAPAAAAPGTWPSGVPYRQAVLCAAPDGTTALAAWKPSGANNGYAAGDIFQPTPPAPAAPGAPATPVTPTPAATNPTGNVNSATAVTVGQLGLVSTNQISALGYLLTVPGTSNDAATVAEVAATIANLPGAAAHTNACLATNPSGATPADAQQLWIAANRYAGPYTVTVTSGALIIDSKNRVTARVTTPTGTGVPGIPVKFTAATGALTATTAVTDNDGNATTTLTPPHGYTTGTITVAAAATTPGTPKVATTPGNVPMVIAGDPVTVNGQADLTVDTTADPRLVVTYDQDAPIGGAQARINVAVTGMKGHDGKGAVTVYGPLPYLHDTGCTTYTAANFSDAIGRDAKKALTVSTATITVTGDTTITKALAAALVDSGCYTAVASITSTNATPNSTASSAPADPGTVITAAPVSVALHLDNHGLTSGGPVGMTVAISGDQSNQTSAVLYGPLDSNAGNCPTTGWGNAAQTPVNAATQPDGHNVRLTTGALSALGCYNFDVRTTIALPAATGIAPFTLRYGPGSLGTSVFLINASVEVVRTDPNGLDGKPVDTTVQVHGTFNRRSLIEVHLYRLPDADSSTKCWSTDYGTATDTGVVATVISTGDNAYRIQTGHAPTWGCYSVVARITAIDNPNITAVSKTGSILSLAIVAARPDPPKSWSQPYVNNDNPHRVAYTFGAFGGVIALCLMFTGAVIIRSRRT